MKTELLRASAATLEAGITSGHDWPNTQGELDRINSARWLREAAAEIERLRAEANRPADTGFGPMDGRSEG